MVLVRAEARGYSMRARRLSSHSSTAGSYSAAVVLGLASAVWACGDDDSNGSMSNGGTDAGVLIDAGAEEDTGPADTGSSPDTGPRDAVPRPDAGYYCTTNGAETVEGESVTIPEATENPQARGRQASTICIDRDVTAVGNNRAYCFTQCVDFFGFIPTPAQINELEVDVFQAERLDGSRVDPSFDIQTRQERSPDERVGAGFVVTTSAQQCASGYQIELGFIDAGETLFANSPYVIRVRSANTPNPTWVPTYTWNFIRRFDEIAGVDCGNNDNRTPQGEPFEFPVASVETVREALQTTGTTVAGSDNLFDGQGPGYAMVETRDCATSGTLTENLTVGLAPTAAGGAYVGMDGKVSPMATDTTERGLYFALGLGAMDASDPTDVRAAVGVNREGACTEAFGGKLFPVYPDSVTFVRMNRETTIQ